VHEKHGNVVVMATLDNLVKGMAGQAIQNLNIALAFDVTTNLGLANAYYPA
jgi:N-acetyl-gamma-glutamyl-phosphate reductase